MYFFKRVISSILVLTFLVSVIPVFAENTELDDTYRTLISGTEEDVAKFPNGKIEFLYSTIDATEGGAENELVVLRRGGTAGVASVDVKFIDISASYNKDYYIEVDGSHYQPEATFPSFMEAYVDKDLSVDEEDVSSIKFDILSEPKPIEEQSVTEQKEEKTNSLIEDRNAYLGNESDRFGTDGRLAGADDRAEYNEKSQSLFNGTEGLSIPLTFADGEFEKRLKVCIVDDDVYKGQRQATFSLVNIQTAVLGDNMNGYINVTDNEEVEKSTITTVDTVYANDENNTATLTLERTSGINTFTVVDIKTQDGTAVAGEDYRSVTKNIIFVPGATTRTVTIPVAKDVTEDKKFEILLSSKEDAVLERNSVTVNLQPAATQTPEDVPVSTQQNVQQNAIAADTDLEYVQYFGSDFKHSGGSSISLDGTSVKMGRNSTIELKKLDLRPYYKAEVYLEDYYEGFMRGNTLKYRFTSSKNLISLPNTNDLSKSLQGKIEPTVYTSTFKKSNLTNLDKMEVISMGGVNPIFHWVKLYKRQYNVDLVTTQNSLPALPNNYYSEGYVPRYWYSADSWNDGAMAYDGKANILNSGISISGIYSGNPATLHATSSSKSKYVGYRLIDKDNNASEIIKSDQISMSDEFINKYWNYLIDAFDTSPSYSDSSDRARATAKLHVQPIFERINANVTFADKNTKGKLLLSGANTPPKGAYIGDVLDLEVKASAGYTPGDIVVVSGESLKNDGSINGVAQIVKGTYNKEENKFKYQVELTAKYVSIEPTFSPHTLTLLPAYGTPENAIKRGNIFTLIDENQKDIIIEGLAGDLDTTEPSDFPVVMAATDTENGKNKIKLGPIKLNTPYLFSYLPNPNDAQKYIVSWTNASGLKDMTQGEVGGSDQWRLDQKKNDPNFNSAIYGNDVNLLPLYRNSGWYYSFVPISESTDYVGGTIKINEINMMAQENQNFSAEEKATKVAPCYNAVVTISGLKDDSGQPYRTHTDENGKFFIDNVKGMLNGHQYAITVEYNNQKEYTFATAGNTGMEIILDPFKIMSPNNIRVTLKNENEALNLSSITYAPRSYDFHFNVTSKHSDINVKSAYITFYSYDGRPITTYKARKNPSGSFTVPDIKPTNTRLELDGYDDSFHVGLPQNLQVGAYAAIWVMDENDNVYPEVKTGISFIQGLAETISLKLGFNMQPADTSENIPLLGAPDGTVELNANIQNSQKETDIKEFKEKKIPFTEDKMDINGHLSTESVIGAGIGKSPLINTANDLEARKMIMEADQEGIRKMAEEAGENEFLSPVPISNKTMFQFDFGLRLRLDYNEQDKEWQFGSLLGAANLRAALGQQEMLTTVPIWGPFQVILKMGITANVYGMVSISNDPTKDFLVTVGNNGDLEFEPDWLINDKLSAAVQLYISGTIMGGVGVGFGKCLYVSVDVSGTVEIMFDTFKKGMGSVTFGVGVEVRLLVFSLKFDISQKKIQMYSYGYDQANQDMQHVMTETIQDEMTKVMDMPLSELEPMARNYLSQAKEFSGNSFLRAVATSPSKLKDGVYPYPKSQLVDISYGGAEKSMLIFLDDNRERGDNNRTELYYRINNNGVWEKQTPIFDDGTLDDSFHVLDSEDKVLITWTNASRAITNEDVSTNAVKLTRIKSIVYDKATGTFGQPMDVTKADDDNYADTNPTAILAPNGDIMVFYTSTDYGNVNGDGGLNNELIPDDTLNDLSNAYSALCYKVWEKGNQAWRTDGSYNNTGKYFLNTQYMLKIDEYKMHNKLPIKHVSSDENGNEVVDTEAPSENTNVLLHTIDQKFSWDEKGVNDPNILEYTANITKDADGKNYVVIAYVRDENYPHNTEITNQQIYMQVYDLTEHTMSKPLRITNDANVRRHSKLRFAVVDGFNVLTWISDESIYDEYAFDGKLPIVPQPAANATVIETKSQIKQFSLAGVMDRIKMAEVTHTGTSDTSSYPYIDKGPDTDGEPIQNLLECGPADEMLDFNVLNANGESVATWTTNEKNDDEMKLYANAFRMSKQQVTVGETTTNQYYVTTPTKIDLSARNANITAFTGLPRSNGQMLFVWNQFKHGLADPLHTMYATLMQPEARPYVSAVKFEGRALPNGKITVSGNVVNESLTDLSGDVTLSILMNNQEIKAEKLSNKIMQPGLGAGDRATIEAEVTLPEDISSLNFTVDLNQDGKRGWETSGALMVKGEITVDPYVNLSFVSREEAQATFKVKNTGNAVTNAGEIPIICGEKTVATAKIPALQIDEEYTQTITFPISADLFEDDGLKEADGYSESAIFEIKGDIPAKGFLRRNISKEQIDAIGLVTDFAVENDSLSIKQKNESKIVTTANNLNANTHITYYSSNPDIAEVYSDGTVKGLSRGTATIYAVLKPRDTSVVVSENPYSAQSNYLNIPEKYLQYKEIQVNVSGSSGGGSKVEEIKPETVEPPKVSVASGEVAKGEKVELSCGTKDAKIYYTLDGTTPTKQSTLYNKAIEIEAATTLKAIAIVGDKSSPVLTVKYTIKGEDIPVAPKFTDLKSCSWAEKEIVSLAQKGVIKGISDTEFAPENNITRADYIALLVRLLGLSTDFSDNFSDVDKNAYYYNEVGIAKALGLTDGIGDNKFNPEAYITRQEMFSLAYRMLKMQKITLEEPSKNTLESFDDYSKISDYAQIAFATLVKNNLIKGSDYHLYPINNATRAETAVFVYRINELMTKSN